MPNTCIGRWKSTANWTQMTCLTSSQMPRTAPRWILLKRVPPDTRRTVPKRPLQEDTFIELWRLKHIVSLSPNSSLLQTFNAFPGIRKKRDSLVLEVACKSKKLYLQKSVVDERCPTSADRIRIDMLLYAVKCEEVSGNYK
eukprot:scaffold1399_cov410-Prasinococcus_capsulatus_cf.AAC.15